MSNTNMKFNINLAALYENNGSYRAFGHTVFGYTINKQTDNKTGKTEYSLVCGELLAKDGDEVEINSMHFDSISIVNHTDNYGDGHDMYFRLSHGEFNIVSNGMLKELYAMGE